MDLDFRAVLLLVITVTGVTIAPVATAHTHEEDGLLSSAFDTVEDANGNGIKADDAAARWVDASVAGLDRLQWSLSRSSLNPFSKAPENTAEQEAAAVQTYFNAHNQSLQSYLNNRTSATSEADTLRVRLTIGEETATRYVTATAADGNYSGLQMSETLADGREIDDKLHVCGFAAEQAEEELQHFTEEYAASGEEPSQEYLATMTGKYGADTESTLLPTAGDCEVQS